MGIEKFAALSGGLADYFLGKAELPPVATLVTLTVETAFQYVNQVKEKNFRKRLEIFFTETNKTSDQERVDFLESLNDNGQKFWDRTLLVLERIDEERKAEMIGRLCSALILRNINADQYYRVSTVIDRIHAADLDFFYIFFESHFRNQRQIFNDLDITVDIVNDLTSNGLMTPHTGQTGHYPTNLGMLIFNYALKR